MACNLSSSCTADIPSRPILVATNNPKTNFQLDTSLFVVGRSPASYCINDETISPYHCLFTLEGKTCKLYDVSSSGTYVNGLLLQINKPRVLTDRDVIRFGGRPINSYMFYADSRKYGETVPKEKAKEVETSNVLNRELLPYIEEIMNKNRQIETLKKALKAKSDVNKKLSEEYVAYISDIIEAELSCVICSELLYEAVSLSCGHMTCKLCLAQWKCNHTQCPLCGVCIKSEASAYQVNSVLSALIPKLSKDVIAARYKVLLDRGNNVSDLEQLKPRSEEVIDLTEED